MDNEPELGFTGSLYRPIKKEKKNLCQMSQGNFLATGTWFWLAELALLSGKGVPVGASSPPLVSFLVILVLLKDKQPDQLTTSA
jgi:hypothetical protein